MRKTTGLVLVTLLTACPGGAGGGEDSAGDEGINLETQGDSNGDGGVRFDIGNSDGADGAATMEEGETDDCPSIQVEVEQTPPTIVLLVDQSGSMTDNFQGVSRWDAVDQTLFDDGAGVVYQRQDAVRFGLSLYTSDGGFGGGECPMLTEAAPAFGNADALAQLFDDNDPESDTPTGDSIDGVAPVLAALDVPGPKIIALATDGEPDTCEVPNPQEGQEEAVTAAQAAFAMGVETKIISVGNDVSDAHLQEMANAGVGLPPDDAMKEPFFKALEPQDLIDAFDAIIGDAISCEFEVDGIVDLDQMCEGTVTLDDVELECPVEWTMLDESTLVLLGEACETLKNGEPHEVTATFPCGAIMIP